jgi:hypothetical protein
MDGDADIDASDIGCMVAMLIGAGLGALVKKAWRESRKDEIGINWSRELNNEHMESINVEGRTLSITLDLRGKKEYKILFAVEDGERLNKELSFRYPQAIYI